LEQAVLKKNYSLRNIPLLDLPDGVHIEYRDGFGIAVNYSDQKQSLPLPAGTEYVIGGKEIPVAGVAVWKIRSYNEELETTDSDSGHVCVAMGTPA
jgi:beta-galactosidase